VQRFHSTYYRPDNALLIVVGDVDPAQLDGWVDRYFGRLKSPATAIPRVTVQELPRQRDARVSVKAPNVPLPALALVWKAPPARHADAPALQVASALLSAGESSRLNEALVYRAQAAQAASSSADLNADAGLFVAYAIAANGQRTARLETMLLAELRRLASAPIPPAELDKVRTQLLTAALSSRQTPQGQAQAIGQAVLLHGEVAEADRGLQRLQAVSAADVQRVLKTWVLGTHRMTIDYSQGAGA
jgi:zinc protease